jgi:acid phosphatase family membrane protein YuiD
MSLLIIVGRKTGVESVEFAIAVVFASIVWYDAFHARRELGLQAEMLNRLQNFRHFTTQLGHSFKEVLGGIAFGAIVTAIGIWMT